MNLILLPGNSKSNKEWIDEVRDSLQNLFLSTHVIYYDHWFVDEKKDIDLEVEQRKLVRIAEDLDEYVIFAKSAGSLLAIKSVREGLIHPKKCIFAGHPVNWARYKEFPIEKWIKDFAVPSLFIQKTSDPSFGFFELSNYLHENNVQEFELLEIPGDDHNYEDLELIRREIERFIS